AGFTVGNELLVLNNAGIGGLGALYNVNGNNSWSSNVILGSPSPFGSDVSIGVAGNTNLTISGVIDDPNGVNNLTKVGLGELIFTSATTYRGSTTVAAGTLDIRDSKALGCSTLGQLCFAGTTVQDGATLALEVDTLIDSVTGNDYSLQIAEPVTIAGTGFGKRGALDSISGINTYTANISLYIFAPEAAIGVEA